jgi:hypothetical protein
MSPSMTKTRCGPKSIYTEEQGQWLEAAKKEFLKELENKHEPHWEVKWKNAKAKAFVAEFSEALGGDLELWQQVRTYITDSDIF